MTKRLVRSLETAGMLDVNSTNPRWEKRRELRLSLLRTIAAVRFSRPRKTQLASTRYLQP